ncbi:MAG: exonuclease VII small subunit [Euryarchaeota archaeon]|nr:exonuclease VII small subunit [Euryarchaeota archaeon]
MKEKILPDDNSSKSIDELTEEANKIIDNLEKEKDLQNSLDNYQKLIKLNNTIEKKFYARSKEITQDYKDRIKKNEKKT